MRFLDQLAELLLRHHGRDLGRVAVVLPSRRAGLHLRKYLAQRAHAALWSPEILDPGTFLSRLAGIEQADPLHLLLLLHATQVELLGNESEPLEEFLQWAPALLRDMSEVDAHLLDPEVVYRDLRQYHELDAWSFLGTDPLSAGQLRIVEQWRRMGELHKRFADRLKEAGLGTYGSIAKAASERVRANDGQTPWDAVWIAGLNAIEPALSSVIGALHEKESVRLAWDADSSYLDDRNNEAGRFLRRSIIEHGAGLVPAGVAIRERTRSLDFIAVSDSASLVQHAADWIAQLSPGQREDAVVVLADEGLLLPLLEAVDPGSGMMNVTMGIPLRSLPVSGLEQRFLALQVESRGFLSWPTDKVRSLLSHPMLHEGSATLKMLASLRDRDVAFEKLVLSAQEAQLESTERMAEALRPMTNDSDLPERMRSLLSWAAHVQRSNPLACEQLFQLSKAAQLLDAALETRPGRPSAEAYRILRERVTRDVRLNLFGEPLAGLQVMGLLESRALDHRHVLVLGANEGTLGGGDPPATWIPFDLRRHYGLPLPADADAVTSYHMHRLLHHAERIQLAYASGGAQDKSPSRFIAQWKHSFADSVTTSVATRARSAPMIQRAKAGIAVEKTEAVLASLRARARKGFSPSALGSWLSCTLDFHARYVLGVRDESEDPSRLAPNILGDALHASMEAVLRPYLGHALNGDALRAAAADADHLILDKLRNLGIQDEALQKGHHRLVASMGAAALKRYLVSEANRCTHQHTVVRGLEEPISASISGTYRITGKFDRMETRDGLLHLLDLKSGRVDERLLHLASIDRSAITRRHGQALQLICYAIMAFEGDSSLQGIKAGIIPLRSPSAFEGSWLTVNGQDVLRREQLHEMRELVVSIIDEILDPSVPFRHDPESGYCTACIE